MAGSTPARLSITPKSWVLLLTILASGTDTLSGGAGRDSMISALQRLAANDGQSTLPKAIQAFGITGEGGFARLLRSHPPIEERIAALRAATAA